MYIAYDLETENHLHLGRKASPFCKDNFIVAVGWKKEGGDVQHLYSKTDVGLTLPIDKDVDLLVGFNIKFDNLYTWNSPEMRAFLKRGGKIWDCQYAEYLIKGMGLPHHMLSLDEVALRYAGGKKKIDEVKALWEAGYKTSEIDKDLLLKYLCEGDVPNTELIYLEQRKEAEKLGMIPMIEARMDGLLATTEMEYNGLKIDVPRALNNAKELYKKIGEYELILNKYIGDLPEGLEWNWGSPVHKSCLFFGGTIKYQKSDYYIDDNTGELARKKAYEYQPILDETGEPVRYKSGKRAGEVKEKKVEVLGELKTKIQDFYHKLPGLAKAPNGIESKNTDGIGNALYQTNDDVMTMLAAIHKDNPFFKTFKKYQVAQKDVTTYYISKDKNGKLSGMLTKVDKDNHFIHHSLQHTSTVTGRLSSKNPNLQNVSRGDKSEIKACFISRFGSDGKMMEADYSQLEVVVQGCLSGDKQLCLDLNNKVDFHCKRLAVKLGEDYNEVKKKSKDENHVDYEFYSVLRTNIKTFSFQLAYGAGKFTIAESTGMSIDDVEQLMEIEDKMYPGVSQFNNKVKETVEDSSIGNYVFIPAFGKTVRQGTYVAPSNTRYTFVQQEAPAYMQKRGVTHSFSPTQMKNYPVQGTGGEMVQVVLGKLFRHFLNNNNYDNKAYLVNTVHDCIWADCHNSVVAQVAQDIKPIMEAIPEYYKELFNWDITVPFPVEVEAGNNMLELHHI